VRAVLEFGCKLEGPLRDFSFKDTIKCARSFWEHNSEQVAAATAEKMMAATLGAAESA